VDNFEKYAYWEDIARYDLDTARAMLGAGRYLYVVFMCQQAIEKLVKGLFVLYKKEEPPRTHNIVLVIKKIFNDQLLEIKMIADNKSYQVKLEEYSPFFARLLAYYISERYPSYKEKLSVSIDRIEATEVLGKTEEAFIWLSSLKKFKM
jgi:HEPN domain-containing protein